MSFKNPRYSLVIFGFVASIVIFSSPPAKACMCVSKDDSLESVYKGAQGIYLVAISAIQKDGLRQGNESVSLTLDVLRVLKGESVPQLNAVGYAGFPKVDSTGAITELITSCGMQYIYGSQHIVVKKGSSEIILSKCSENVIRLEQLAALISLIKEQR
ncbi:hypothetical protein ACL7TT_13130 [Microbulbifer sp. 2304DJ12-6]|uniref:hypothetical protein n=1 Tax=Microbulbifer sp. 2304DJ12-6 TaxID=3233340 RepID=UPI0039AFA6BA